jgi:hypothetical protein
MRYPETPPFCALCGIPAIRPVVLAQGEGEKAFCCRGCRTAYEIARDAGEIEERAEWEPERLDDCVCPAE